ncbi:hypothetical protein LCGC14_0895940 [marine sediment metagenome]|uniref:Uncharacterized protein n=1 Tax=marine sediment metagenome TaxID=412755 RepID=A0A0F9NY02_9ZZZZ
MPVSKNPVDQLLKAMGVDFRELDKDQKARVKAARAFCNELVDVPPDRSESDKAKS